MQRRLFGMSLLAAAAGPQLVHALERIKFRELYGRGGKPSDLALANQEQDITIEGFMAPPLKAMSEFFVLTKLPMSTCPFCEDEADWPDNIVVVYTDGPVDIVPFNYPIAVTGKLELGKYVDEKTGFFSKVRLVDARYEKL